MKDRYMDECGEDGKGCRKGREFAAILQTSDCMIECCEKHVWLTK